jgi:predicted ATPase
MRRAGYTNGAGDGDGLLERGGQLALLNEALTAAAEGGRGRTVLVVGEAGIGKTALLRGFGDSAAGSARVLWAGCDHLFTARPLGPFLDLAEAAGGQLAARIGDAARPYDVAAAFLAEFG